MKTFPFDNIIFNVDIHTSNPLFGLHNKFTEQRNTSSYKSIPCYIFNTIRR